MLIKQIVYVYNYKHKVFLKYYLFTFDMKLIYNVFLSYLFTAYSKARAAANSRLLSDFKVCSTDSCDLIGNSNGTLCPIDILLSVNSYYSISHRRF